MCPCSKKNCNCEILASYIDRCSKLLHQSNAAHHLNMTVFNNECPNSNQFNALNSSQANNLNQSRNARNMELLFKSGKRLESDQLTSKSIKI